jgi:hypothetical protein
MEVVGQDRHELGIGDRAPLVELHELALVLALAGAVLAAAELEHHRVGALELGELVELPSLVRELEVRKDVARLEVLEHVFPLLCFA